MMKSNLDNSISGIYKHWKGDLYIVFGEGVETETNTAYVVYKAFLDPDGQFFLRTKEQFFSKVTIGDEVEDRFFKLEEGELEVEITRLLEMLATSSCDVGCTDCDSGCSCDKS
jgi:hypothetical protein